jgi:hypothetical protein
VAWDEWEQLKAEAAQKQSPKMELNHLAGVFAETAGSENAILYFSCPTKGPDGADNFLSASIVTGLIGYKSDTIGRDFMEVLNSTSRHLAMAVRPRKPCRQICSVCTSHRRL